MLILVLSTSFYPGLCNAVEVETINQNIHDINLVSLHFDKLGFALCLALGVLNKTKKTELIRACIT